jgi:hypothetical protein
VEDKVPSSNRRSRGAQLNRQAAWISSRAFRWWLFVTAALAIASAVALALLASEVVIPSLVRDPLSTFVQPGVTVWWFVLGGPFQTAPLSDGGIAFAAGANAMLWSLALWCGNAIVRAVLRKLARSRQ